MNYNLTAREIQVLKLVWDDHPNKEIAIRLQIAENTVKQHLYHILAKLNVRSKVGAVRKALAMGILHVEKKPVTETTRSRRISLSDHSNDGD